MASVTAGVADAKDSIGITFHVQSVEYVANDTGPEEVYRMMAKALVEASHEDAEKKSKDFQTQFGNKRKN